jgi:hypothetical protein
VERLISEPVQVQRDEAGAVEGFRWRGRWYGVRETLADGRQLDYQPRWYLRRHRRRVVVRVEDGRCFELYADRPGHWVLYRELADPLT